MWKGSAQNYHTNLRLPLVLQSLKASLLSCLAYNFIVLTVSHCSRRIVLTGKKALKTIACNVLSTKRQTK